MESTPEDPRSRQFRPSSVTRAGSYEDEVPLVNYPDQIGPLPQEFYYRATAEASLSVSTLYIQYHSLFPGQPHVRPI